MYIMMNIDRYGLLNAQNTIQTINQEAEEEHKIVVNYCNNKINEFPNSDPNFHIYNELDEPPPPTGPIQPPRPLTGGMPIPSNNLTGGIIYGFRTRHLSCIEENDSDSLHSTSVPPPFEMMQEMDENFKKLANETNCLNDANNTDDNCGGGEELIAMIDESRLYDMEYLDDLSASKIVYAHDESLSDEEEDEEQLVDHEEEQYQRVSSSTDMWRSTTSEPIQRSSTNLVHGGLPPDIMMTSCYGSLNSPFPNSDFNGCVVSQSMSTSTSTSMPSKQAQQQQQHSLRNTNRNEPIYATPEKRREANRSFDSSCQSGASSIYGAFDAPHSMTSSLDLKCMSISSASGLNGSGSFGVHQLSNNGTMPLDFYSFTTMDSGNCSANVNDLESSMGMELAHCMSIPRGSAAEELSEELTAKCIGNAKNDLQSIRRLLDHDASGTICPSCRTSFDKGKRRKLIDTCGHERCYSCMFRNDQCPMCMNSSLKDVDGSNAQGGYDTGIGGSTSTIVSPLGSPQPQLRSQVQRANAAATLAKLMQQQNLANNNNNNAGRQETFLLPEQQSSHLSLHQHSNQNQKLLPNNNFFQQQQQQHHRYASVSKLPRATTHTVTADVHHHHNQHLQVGGNHHNNYFQNNSSSSNNNNNSSSIENYGYSELNSAAASSAYATPPTRRRFFNHKNLRNALTGHRRAASNGGVSSSTSGSQTGASSSISSSGGGGGASGAIDVTASILSGASDHSCQDASAAEKQQKEQLRARLGLFLDNDHNLGSSNGGIGSCSGNTNTTTSSSSSQNICMEASTSQQLKINNINSNTNNCNGLSMIENFGGSQLSVAMKHDDTISLTNKFKAACNLLTDSNGYDSGPSVTATITAPQFPVKVRKSVARRSARTASAAAGHVASNFVSSSSNNTSNSNSNATAGNKRQAIYKPAPVLLPLKPLFFEVPLQEPDPPFIGRQWLLRELSNILTGTETPGVLINGNPGTGKTALILQLVEYSCFGRRKDAGGVNNSTETDGIYCQINLCHERLRALASYIVGYHFCQADANLTCLVADFVHSLAAQLCQAPQLAAYRDYLLSEPHLQDILSVKECIADAERVMRMAILEPLTILKRSGKIPAKTCVILVDALCEAEYHRPDHGHTIATFLAKITQHFPSWLKVVATVRTQMLEFVKGLSYTKMTLDSWANNDLLQKDMLDYITFRVSHSAQIQSNIASSSSSTAKETSTTGAQSKFVGHLQALTKGSMLYAKLILDLIERGQLVIKSSSYKVLPVSLAQIFLLHFNLRFPTTSSFDKAAPILNVCLAALYPLTLNEIYYTICALKTDDVLSWDEFMQRFNLLDGFLIKRIDNTYMFFHSSFREWLIRRDEGESTKFLCDFRLGHAAIAFRLSRLHAPLSSELTLELGHHMLKAHIYRNSQGPQSPRDMQSFWISSVTDNISAALGSLRNVYSPNLKVSRLMLLAGASPHYRTEFMGDATILCIAAHEGIVPMVSLLLEFGADVGLTNSQGCTPLILAAMRGHCDVVRLLVAAGSSLGQTDTTQRCALVHAARMGRLNVVKYLLACDWTPRSCSHDLSLKVALQQALIAAASQDHVTILEDLLEVDDLVDINQCEPISGDLALNAAAKNGCVDTVAVLISRGAKINCRNKQGYTPLLLAVKDGHWMVTEKLLQNGANIDEPMLSTMKTPLMIAAEEGHNELLEFLIERGASLEAQDHEGFTALSWACLRGRQAAAKCLIERGCNKQHSDNNGRTALDLAAYQGSAALVQYLLEQGASIEHIDVNGMRPLDRAIACRNIQVVQVFLRKGAKLGPTTWSMAMGKPEISVVLLNKLLEDGNILYRRNRFQEAAHRYQYALRKISNLEGLLEKNTVFAQLRTNLLLNLSRCKRKLNELDASIDLASQAITQKPGDYEGYYARAKARMECGETNDALVDANAALERAAQCGVALEVIEVLRRIQNELLVRITSENNNNDNGNGNAAENIPTAVAAGGLFVESSGGASAHTQTAHEQEITDL